VPGEMSRLPGSIPPDLGTVQDEARHPDERTQTGENSSEASVDTDGAIDDGRRAGDRVIEPAPGESLIRPAERRR